jgi:hypothetical protein
MIAIRVFMLFSLVAVAGYARQPLYKR